MAHLPEQTKHQPNDAALMQAGRYQDSEVIALQTLPRLTVLTLHQKRDVFEIQTTIILVAPASVLGKVDSRSEQRQYAIESHPKILCSVSTSLFISSTYNLSEVLNHLATYAQSAFALNLKNRKRWGCALGARCEGMSGLFDEENFEFLLSASSQGGWGWKFYLAELEESSRGIWESITNMGVVV